ncbi:hypothetical protein NEUTE2DRAFT_129547 [Neurospora tetrasperma FGSC 2509]|nr:hypothetical protein NEUTE2DRAFT_129547 [Neurospora tetrasperma FGSC 2509]
MDRSIYNNGLTAIRTLHADSRAPQTGNENPSLHVGDSGETCTFHITLDLLPPLDLSGVGVPRRLLLPRHLVIFMPDPAQYTTLVSRARPADINLAFIAFNRLFWVWGDVPLIAYRHLRSLLGRLRDR